MGPDNLETDSLRVEIFYQTITARDYPRSELIGACKIIYSNRKATPSAGWKKVHDRFHHWLLINKGNDPELMLAFVRDLETGPVFGSGCLSMLFAESSRDHPGIEAMRDEGVEAFLKNIPAYGGMSGAWDEKSCVIFLAESIPVQLHSRYGIRVTAGPHEYEDALGVYSGNENKIVFRGKTYFF